MGEGRDHKARMEIQIDHKIVDMTWPTIACKCGWETRLLLPESWGRKRGADQLLDRHAEHVVKATGGGNPVTEI